MGNKTKKDIVYESIMKKINSGILMPGVRLIESDLATAHKVSRTIVRDAIKHLTNEGIVNSIPYKGAFVAPLSISDYEQINRILQELEGLAVYLATPHLSDSQLIELEQNIIESKKYIIGNIAEWLNLNSRFHDMFLKNCQNKHLSDYIRKNKQKFSRYTYILVSLPGSTELLINEHQEMFDAVKARNAELGRSLMENHIVGATTRLLNLAKSIHPSSFTF